MRGPGWMVLSLAWCVEIICSPLTTVGYPPIAVGYLVVLLCTMAKKAGKAHSDTDHIKKNHGRYDFCSVQEILYLTQYALFLQASTTTAKTCKCYHTCQILSPSQQGLFAYI